MVQQTGTTRQYCNCVAQERGLDPAGYAGSFDDAVLIEHPLPWSGKLAQVVMTLPPPLVKLFALWRQRHDAGQGYSHRPLMIAPDADYSPPGYRRIIFYRRPSGLFANFEKTEYLAPEEQFGDLIWAFFEASETLSDFEIYRTPVADTIRDILVCTQGSVDAACGKFGYPLYKYLRDHLADETLRIWRVSHFGGHVFAPTLMDMPAGHYWAHMTENTSEQMIRRSGSIATLRPHFRGSATMNNGFIQVVDCTLWQQRGWQWFDVQRQGAILKQDTADNPQWAEVQIQYQLPSEALKTIIAHVEVSHTLETIYSSSHDRTHPYSQYRVTHIEEVS